MDQTLPALDVAHRHAAAYVTELPDRQVAPDFDSSALTAVLGALPDDGTDAEVVVDRIATLIEPGIVAMSGPRYFGFVIGATLPAALGADWLVSAWDQNTGLLVTTPSISTAENVAGAWLLDLLGLPSDASFGFVTGGQMANWTGLAAARHAVLQRAGWDLERQGLTGAPRLHVVVGAERHATIDRSLRFLGLGSDAIVEIASDGQGRMIPDALTERLNDLDGPIIVCAQTGNVNTGAFDDVGSICDVAHETGAWVHVDGAIGLMAAASPNTRHLVSDLARADSWSTDAHKLLNAPYDCGFVATAHPAAHAAACGASAAYLEFTDQGREPMHFNPEFSRRARSLPVLAALMQLGRRGTADLVDGLCAAASRFATRLDEVDGIEVLNDVVFDQVLVRFLAQGGEPADHDRRTRAVIEGVQRDGTCFMSGTTWHGMDLMRISVASWRTTLDDVDRSVDAILRIDAGL